MLVRQAMVKQQPFEFNTYNTECITDFNTELAIPLGKKKHCKNTGGLCLLKCSNENLAYFWNRNENTSSFFFHFPICGMLVLEFFPTKNYKSDNY